MTWDENSAAAFASWNPEDLKTLSKRVVAALSCAYDGLTEEEIRVVLKANPNSIRGRIRDLLKANAIHRTGTKRETQSEHEAWVNYPGPHPTGTSPVRHQGDAKADRLVALEHFCQRLRNTIEDGGRLTGPAVRAISAELARLQIPRGTNGETRS